MAEAVRLYDGVRLWGQRLSFDVVLGAVLSGLLLVEYAVSEPRATWAVYVWGLATTVPLVVRSRFPVVVSLSVQACFALSALLVTSPESLALGVAAFFVATYTAVQGARTWRAAALCGCASATLVALQGAWDDKFEAPGAVIVNVAYCVMVWIAAALVRRHRERSAASFARAEDAVRSSEARAAAAVKAERDRLAAELHDVIAHGLSVILLRARGARRASDADTAVMREALDDVQSVASSAIADMRRLLVLVHDGEVPSSSRPQPSLDDLPELVRLTTAAGVPTSLTVEGSPVPLSGGMALSAYRVVQEALTNVLRHAGGGRAVVALRWSPERLEVRVADDGRGDPHPGTGQGLRGLRDRVEVFGGSLSAGPRGDRGFEVAASFPLGAGPDATLTD